MEIYYLSELVNISELYVLHVPLQRERLVPPWRRLHKVQC